MRVYEVVIGKRAIGADYAGYQNICPSFLHLRDSPLNLYTLL
jgi:hypothetical protein